MSNPPTDDTTGANNEGEAGSDSSHPVYFAVDWKRPGSENNEVLSREVVPCLVCGVLPEPDSEPHKRCSQCRAATYCSVRCQRTDFGEGGHKKNCKPLARLWDEKREIEEWLWKSGGEGLTVGDRNLPKVGHFWVERPSMAMERATTKYCVCLLKLVQMLGRDESWRMKKTAYHLSRRSGAAEGGNPLALSLAINVALDLLYLDRADMRVRLMIPSLLIELDMLQAAYDYIKFWLLPETTATIMELTQMEMTATEAMALPFLHLRNEDMAENPETWMDFDLLYTGLGMVFELALIKWKMASRLRVLSDGERAPESWSEVGSEGLDRHAKLLLSAVHSLNPNLLPRLGGWSYDPDSGQPAAVNELLNVHPPGFDLQYRMGNPGGRSLDEAVAIWQRDMSIWDNDSNAMLLLSTFCSDLEGNIIALPRTIDDEDGKKRMEAEALAERLQRENPSATADAIMMHPKMAALMAEHLASSNSET